MDKQNTDPEMPVDINKLVTLKLMMESMIKLLRHIVERIRNDPRYSSMLEGQAEERNDDVQERLTNMKISEISDIGSCGSTPFVRKTRSDMLSVSSPITPGRVQTPFKIWRDEAGTAGDKSGYEFVSGKEKGTSTEEVCGEASTETGTGSEGVFGSDNGRDVGDDGSAERYGMQDIGDRGDDDDDVDERDGDGGEETESDDGDMVNVKTSHCLQ